MEFKLTAEGDVIEQLHNRKRSMLVSIYQTRKYLIFSFKDFLQTNQVVLLDPLMAIAVSGYQLAIVVKNLIINHMNHHNLRQTYPKNVLNTDALSPSKIGLFTNKVSRQNMSVYIECTFSSLSDFIITLHLHPFARLHLSIMQVTTIITALHALARINNKKLQRLMK
ncbi:hypothetical protein [Colwellia psychrerythraea]|uniref:Uncharacterized protein n=1 Tax=Colwellia psychrerythraea TaxID=28229 RepID=A0A099KFZ1_COLPS|nr:hypothetical protein [Colwellia psychrerythraea]KGJ89669.1 hypothetical protein ND2E_3860 [Colwellia psychrerythraea]